MFGRVTRTANWLLSSSVLARCFDTCVQETCGCSMAGSGRLYMEQQVHGVRNTCEQARAVAHITRATLTSREPPCATHAHWWVPKHNQSTTNQPNPATTERHPQPSATHNQAPPTTERHQAPPSATHVIVDPQGRCSSLGWVLHTGQRGRVNGRQQAVLHHLLIHVCEL